jgi:methyl-accepting chemotaxis protein
MNIQKQLMALVSIALVGIITIFGLGVVKLDQVYDETNFCNVNSLPSIVLLDDAIQDASSMRTNLWKSVVENDKDEITKLDAKIRQSNKDLNTKLNRYEKELTADEQDKAFLNADREAISAYMAIYDKVMPLIKENKDEEASKLLIENEEKVTNISHAFKEHIKYNEDLSLKAADSANTHKTSAKTLIIAISIITVLIMILNFRT